jgi:hypothetical protein
MRVAIMGSGGVGAYVGSRLQAAGEDVVFIARGAHLAALQKDGLRLESPVHPLHLPTVNAVQEPSMVGRTAGAGSRGSRSRCPRWSAGCGWWPSAQWKWPETGPRSRPHRACPSVAGTGARRWTGFPRSGAGLRRTACQRPGWTCRSPDSPVITTSWLLGMSRSMFFRLCVRAPRMLMVCCCSARAR